MKEKGIITDSSSAIVYQNRLGQRQVQEMAFSQPA
jgi:hypothetical protein